MKQKGRYQLILISPGNLKPDFTTPDLDTSHIQLAEECVDYQLENDFKYLVIPCRYYSDNPSQYFTQSTDYFVTPFCEYVQVKSVDKKILLSVIVKSIMLSDLENGMKY